MAIFENQIAKANRFRELHRRSKTLVLPNVWDVAGARMLEESGVEAIATTSAGIAFALGYPDGEKISRQEMCAMVARIAAKVKLPVTADAEAGYGDRPEDAGQTAWAVIEAGAVGLNLEDGTDNPRRPLANLSWQLERIAAVRETARAMGVPLVLNARTDVYLLQVGKPESRFDETLRRISAFKNAGADCLFVPGVRDLEVISRLVRELQHPLNILAGPGSPPISELQKIGVARVSLGSSPMRATLGLLRRIAQELQTAGTYNYLEGAPSHAEVNRLLS